MTVLNEDNTCLGGCTIDPQEVKQELLSKYPTKVARKRAKQIIVNEVGEGQEVPEIGANTRTIPGIITQRGCTYAGCKGVDAWDRPATSSTSLTAPSAAVFTPG